MPITGTAAEITPVRSIDNIQIGPGARASVTKEIQEAFFGIIQGAKPDAHGLTPVYKAEIASNVVSKGMSQESSQPR